MRDPELHDRLHALLHERVADVTMPDASGAAWAAGTRRRRRRTTGAVAGAVAAVVVAALAGGAVTGSDRSERPVPPASQDPSPTPSVPGPTPTSGPVRQGTRPDGHYRGWRVYREPGVADGAGLPRAASPLPATVDLSAPATDLAQHPVASVLAAYAVSDVAGGTRLLLLARDGSLRSVDTSRVAPLDDGTGTDVSVARETLLSPTGEYLAFPQAGGVEVLSVATGAWRRIGTGRATTAYARWLGDTDLWLPASAGGAAGPMYSVTDGARSGGARTPPPAGPLGAGITPVGRSRTGPTGEAQVWAGVRGLPAPVDPGSADGADGAEVLLVEGDSPAGDALLALGDGAASGACCGVQFWLAPGVVAYAAGGDPQRLVAWRVGTHRVSVVTTVEGVDPATESLVGSYTRIWR